MSKDKNIIKFGTKIRKCRHGKATYIFVKCDVPDNKIDDNGLHMYGPCINCVSGVSFYGVKKDLYRPCTSKFKNYKHYNFYNVKIIKNLN